MWIKTDKNPITVERIGNRIYKDVRKYVKSGALTSQKEVYKYIRINLKSYLSDMNAVTEEYTNTALDDLAKNIHKYITKKIHLS